MGKNKLKKFEDMDSYPHVFQFPFSKIQEQGFHLKNHWHTNFFQNNHPIVLELGCGKGEYTVELAKLFPEKNFIGIDIKGARMWTGAKASLEQKMNNVAFIRTNIELITHFFGTNEVSEIWITFIILHYLTKVQYMILLIHFLLLLWIEERFGNII